MITQADVRDFQSVASATLEFPSRSTGGGITTITGPSSSGKSALLRAIRAVVRNISSAPVRAGQKNITVTLSTSTGDQVVLERGPGLSTYRIILANGKEELYAKSNTGVPDDVAKVLGLRAGPPDPHFSFQFDRPYLLSEPGSSVSRIIGELTNANVLAEAVREGARRGLRAKQLAETRRKDVEEAVARLKGFAGLGLRETGLVEAREVLKEASVLAGVADQVEQLYQGWALATVALEQARQKILSIPDVKPLLEEATVLTRQAGQIDQMVQEWLGSIKASADYSKSARAYESAASGHQEEYVALLRKMGRCPVCGQTTEGVAHE